MARTYLKETDHGTIEIEQAVTDTVRDIFQDVRERGEEAGQGLTVFDLATL